MTKWMRDFRKLNVWSRSFELVKKIYGVTKKLPHSENYGLTRQMNRAAISIPSNIAEGCARVSDKDFSHFLSIALGSSFELETQLLLVQELKLIDREQIHPIVSELNEIQKMINALRKKNQAPLKI